jgi:hypothetical protein
MFLSWHSNRRKLMGLVKISATVPARVELIVDTEDGGLSQADAHSRIIGLLDNWVDESTMDEAEYADDQYQFNYTGSGVKVTDTESLEKKFSATVNVTAYYSFYICEIEANNEDDARSKVEDMMNYGILDTVDEHGSASLYDWDLSDWDIDTVTEE